jgi:hypothetical protein
MIDLLLELLFNRLGLMILAVVLVVGGVYVWKGYRAEASLYDASVGTEGRTAMARIAWKGTENDSESDSSVDYLKLEYDFEGEVIETKVYVDPQEFAAYDLSDEIQIRFNPSSKQFVVTPQMKRPSVFLATAGSLALIIIGSLIFIAVLISFF